jgi:hypothetical protein
MRPACIKCQRFLKPKKNGAGVLECIPGPGSPPAGTAGEGAWRPYKFWMADIWECRGCGLEVAAGSGAMPLSEHHQERFPNDQKVHGVYAKINDW